MGYLNQTHEAVDVRTTKSSPIEEMDRELERLDAQLERLESLLGPVMSHYATEKMSVDVPMVEPATQLRGFTARLQGRLARLDRIMNDIDL